MRTPGRNEPCPCGSGKRYKQCCGQCGAPSTDGVQSVSSFTPAPPTIQAAMSHHQAGRIAQAKSLYLQILQEEPHNLDALHYISLASHQMGEIDNAIAYLQKVIALVPGDINAHNNLGNIFHGQGKLREAATCYRNALVIKPDDFEVKNNLGNILQELGQLNEAASCLSQALSLKPDHPELLNNQGNVFHKQGHLEEAIICFNKALMLKPDFASAHYNLGSVSQELGHLNEAMVSFRNALALRPDYIQAHNNLGNALQETGCLDEAADCFNAAIKIDPEFSHAHFNLGNIFVEQRRPDEARSCFQKALELDPEYHAARGNLLHQLQQMCQWKSLKEYSQIVRQAVQEAPATSKNLISPFTFLALPGSTAMEQKRCAEKWVQNLYQPHINYREKLRFDFNRPPNEKIRIAYLSVDFRNHPVAHLMAEVFELHDRNHFQVTAYSYGVNDGSEIRKRLENAFDQFIDIHALSDEAAAKRIYADKIDILVDLTGYTQHGRSAILALRPAPIQVNYLGYPGTMGAEFIDYLIADRFIIPPEQQELFTEKLVYLPDCYLPRDLSCQRLPPPVRKDCGLPDKGVVFCSFNQSYKITQDIFDVWCRLLKAVPGSVLWLPSNNPHADSNLYREAESRGVSAARIIQAPRLNRIEDHLARLQCADLFLDTAPYNGHTTCSDALWMGLPVVTCVGTTFPSRVAGSLLTALGVPELITENPEDYFTLALKLVTDQTKYEQIRNKIISNRDTAPLFDSERFTRNLELAYMGMK